jgi:hypothetical protein
MDIIQNSISACASVLNIEIKTDQAVNELCITVVDNGSGMDSELLTCVMDPFTTSRKTRKVGLGIPLFKASAERSEGYLSIRSEVGAGTSLTAVFKIDNIDRPPLGEIADTIVNVLMANPDIELKMVLDNGAGKSFLFHTVELKSRLGEVPINEYGVLKWIKDFIDDNIKLTFGGVLNEVNG